MAQAKAKKDHIDEYNGFGIKGRLSNPFDLLKVVGAGVVMFLAIPASQNIAKVIGKKLKFIDSDIEPITSQPVVETNNKRFY